MIVPDGCDFQKAAPAPNLNLSDSPGAKDKSVETRAEKYVIGETYSGSSNFKIMKKVDHLEQTIEKVLDRHEKNSSLERKDTTSVVGAALLAYSCGSESRKAAAKKFLKMVSKRLDSGKTPNLWRLAEARRLYVVVLSQRESPYSAIQRETGRLLEVLSMGQLATENRLEVLSVGQLATESRLEVIDEKLDQLLQKM